MKKKPSANILKTVKTLTLLTWPQIPNILRSHTIRIMTITIFRMVLLGSNPLEMVPGLHQVFSPLQKDKHKIVSIGMIDRFNKNKGKPVCSIQPMMI